MKFDIFAIKYVRYFYLGIKFSVGLQYFPKAQKINNRILIYLNIKTNHN